MKTTTIALIACLVAMTQAYAQTKAPLAPLPKPMNVPVPAPKTDQPYAPQPILQGGIVVPLWPAGSPYGQYSSRAFTGGGIPRP